MEFHTALRRRLLEQPATGQEVKEFSFAEFHQLALSLVCTNARRSSMRGVSPRMRSTCTKTSAQVLFITLHDLLRKRKAEGLGSWVAARRAWKLSVAPPRPLGGCSTSGSDPENFNLFAELLRSQCLTAGILEKQLTQQERHFKKACRATDFIQCLEMLARRALRPAFKHFCTVAMSMPIQLRSSEPPAAAPPLNTLPRRSALSPGLPSSPSWQTSGAGSGAPPGRVPASGRGRGLASSPQSPEIGGYSGRSGGPRLKPFGSGGLNKAPALGGGRRPEL